MTFQSFDDVRRFTTELETVCEWRDDLTARLRRAQLRFDLVGLDADERGALEAEVQTFLQVCRCLAGAPSARAERMAA